MEIKWIVRKCLRKISLKLNRDRYLVKHGFHHGEDFQNFSKNAIDPGWPWLVSVGDHVTISFDVRILAHDASTNLTGARTKVGRVVIGNNVFIGARSLILCNTRIGDNVIIGAGTVVTRDIPSNSVVAGNPARLICSFDEFKERHLANRQTHPIMDQVRWDRWTDASPVEWDLMNDQLRDTFGYL